MGREINFRAWNKHNNTMLKSVAILGIWENFITGFDRNYIHNSQDWGNQEDFAYDFELMQSTGIKDINKVTIYEGDILEGISNNEFSKGNINNYEVMWGIDHWHINGTNFTLQELFNYCNNKIKVIGNIYETPKLYRRHSQLLHNLFIYL